MNAKLPLIFLLSTSFACRNASVKLDENDGDVTEDTGVIDTDTDVEDTGADVDDTGDIIDTGETDTDTDTDIEETDTDETDTDTNDTGDTNDTDTDTDTDTDVDPNEVDDDGDGFTENDGDCDDADANTFPGAAENDSTTDCLTDSDGDGYGDNSLGGTDCDDGDAAINPGEAEIANDGIDNDCLDGDAVDDADGDGVPTDDDCDDTDPNIGTIQDWYLDIDQDGFGSTIIPPVTSCTPQVDGNGNPYSSNADDCDDTNASVYPGAPEVWYDGIDQDCDPSTEYDQDNDGFNIDSVDCDGDGTAETSCDLDGDGVDDFVGGGDCDDTDPASIPTDVDGDGISVCAGDCNDNDATVFPGATEVYWDFQDNDCDGDPDFINRNGFTGRMEGDGGSDALGFDNAMNLTDIDGDGLLDITVGGTFIESSASGAVLFANNTSRTWDNSATWNDAMPSFADKEIAGHEYNYLSSVPQTFGDNNADGTVDIAIAGTDIYDYAGDAYTPAAAIYFDYNTIASYEDMAENADIIFTNTMSAYTGTRLYNQFDFNGDGVDDVIFTDFNGARVVQGGTVRTNPDSWGCSNDCAQSAMAIYDGVNIQNGTWADELDVQSDYDAYIESSSQGEFLGMAVNGADIDGDGDDDMVFTAPGSSESASNGGCVFFIQGYGGLSLNNFNGVTLNTLAFTGNLQVNPLNGVAICSTTDDAYFGWNATPQMADFDGDGTVDLAVGSPVENRVYIYLDLLSMSGVVDASTADIVIDGDRTFGYALSTADLNGDGFEDLLVGAPDIDGPQDMFYDNNLVYDLDNNGNGGRVYIFSGDTLSSGAAFTQGNADGRIGTSDDFFFGSDILTGDMNNDGTPDIFVAEPLWESGNGNSEGAVYYFVSP